MTKEFMINRWIYLSENNKGLNKFTQMAIGRHDKIGDGWRSVGFEDLSKKETITLERNPTGFFIYDNEHRFDLGKDDMYEKMCIKFDNKLMEFSGIK